MAPSEILSSFLISTARFSACRSYRYTLQRTWDLRAPKICWILLNPSTADEFVLDPTLRRCLGFSKTWGFGTMLVVNLFALRSTSPARLYAALDPVGRFNDRHIRCTTERADKVIVGWGVQGSHNQRAEGVLGILAEGRIRAWCLGRTKAGHPKHPLYVPGDTGLVRFGR